MTKRAGRSADNDPQLRALIDTNSDSICLVAKTWDYHVDVALGVSLEENLKSIEDSVKSINENNIESIIDCEHFLMALNLIMIFLFLVLKALLILEQDGWFCVILMAEPYLMRLEK